MFDVCIIGGGLLGTATAYFAARAGLKTLVIEERDLAAGASGAAFGGVSVGIYSYASARVPRPYVELSKASLALYRRLQEELGPPLDFDAPGSLDPFYDEPGLARGRERALGLEACGVPCRLLTRAEVREIEPAVSDAIAGATYCPVDAHVTSLCTVWALARGARRHGAEIRTGLRVERLLTEKGRVIGVETAREKIAAGWVVNVAGLGAAALTAEAGVQIPLGYSRGQMFVSERIPPLLRTYVHNIKQAASGGIVIGATRETGVTEVSTTVAGAREILSWAVRLIPALAEVRLLRSWSGIRPVPPDGYPIIGAVPGLERLLVAVMHRGVTLAPIVGESLVELMLTGRSTLDLAPYDVTRFAASPETRGSEVKESFYGTG